MGRPWKTINGDINRGQVEASDELHTVVLSGDGNYLAISAASSGKGKEQHTRVYYYNHITGWGQLEGSLMGTERGSSPNVSISSDGSHLLLGYPNK